MVGGEAMFDAGTCSVVGDERQVPGTIMPFGGETAHAAENKRTFSPCEQVNRRKSPVFDPRQTVRKRVWIVRMMRPVGLRFEFCIRVGIAELLPMRSWVRNGTCGLK